MKYKIIISDLDGTLLNSDKKISNKDKDSIIKFERLGGIFTIATGRIEKSVESYIRELNLKKPLILYNGAKIFDPISKKSIYEKEINYFDIIKIIEILRNYSCSVIFYSKNKAYVESYNKIIKEYEENDNIKCIKYNKKIESMNINKILIIGNPAIFKEIDFKILSLCNVSTIQSENNYFEILPKDTDKSVAINLLLKKLNLDWKDVVACGDNLNDLQMIQKASLGCIPSNGHKKLHNISNFIGKNNNENFISEVINNILKGE